MIFFPVFAFQRGPVGPRGAPGPLGTAGVPGVDGIDVSLCSVLLFWIYRRLQI